MNKLIITNLLVVFATVLLIVGCGPTPTPTPPGESLEWESVHCEPVSPYEETTPMMRIATTLEQASELEGFLQLPSYLRPASDTDFSTHFAVAVFQGEKMTTGYSIEVVDVRLDDSVITVYAEFLTPGPDVAPGSAVTSPYYILQVKKTKGLHGNFTFVLITNGEEIMRQQHFIPREEK